MAIGGGLLDQIAYLLYLVIPAMVANASPVALSRIIGKGHPIDMGARLPDGRRILGDGKTFEGLLAGVAAGALTGLLLGAAAGRPLDGLRAGAVSGLGAMLGDMAGSFVKRRLGLERGAPAPLLDQLDFYFGSLALLWIAGWRPSIVFALLFAPVIVGLHVATNRLAYALGLKDVPH